MNELSVGLWLRRERERRGVTLRQIADQTKVAVPLLDGLEQGDLSRWPGGIYRRAFVKSYAAALGLDPDAVLHRFEEEHPAQPDDAAALQAPVSAHAVSATPAVSPPHQPMWAASIPQRARLLGTMADLAVAVVLGLGSAAAGSRLLWPVLFISLYYAIGVLLTGTSPMVALLSDQPEPDPAIKVDGDEPAVSAIPAEETRVTHRPSPDRRPTTRRVSRAQRAPKASRPRVQ
ncbi:MAG: helix-turn-helix domain-containing protein [Acidobacteria bacterium]|nr:helix-turn-helix domain-containing protein [Acidobacteriota bacterium]MBA3887310.1 helix-turn-helix domain-containing protein [Acidobacteriota bacterium]